MIAAHLIITRTLENSHVVDLIIEGDGFEPPQVTLDLSDPDDTIRAVLAQVQSMGWQIITETITEETPTQIVLDYALAKR